MTDDLQAARERLRRYQQWASNHYTPVEDNPYKNFTVVTYRMTIEQMADLQELADAYLAYFTESRDAQRREMVEKLDAGYILDQDEIQTIIHLLTEPTP